MSCAAAAAIIEIVQIAEQSLICFPNMCAGADAASVADGLRGPRKFSRKVFLDLRFFSFSCNGCSFVFFGVNAFVLVCCKYLHVQIQRLGRVPQH